LRKQYQIPVNFDDPYELKRRQILEGLISKKIDLEYSIILLDEIQDFTELEWKFLSRLSRRFILLGDFEQRIYNSDLSKSTILSVTQPKVLAKIFRFGSAIAEWVQKFSKSKVDLVSKVNTTGGVKPIAIVCDNPSVENEEIAKIIEARRNDGERLAVISINKNRLAEVHKYLTSKGINHFYSSDPAAFRDLDFSKNDPILITSASAKGLEFYSVIVTGFDSESPAVMGFRANGGFEENIYVCLSRATKHLFVLQNPNTVNELKDLSSSATVEKDEESDWF
jgi:DNA helicase IV